MEHFVQNFRELVWNDKYYAQPTSHSYVKPEQDIIESLERTTLTSCALPESNSMVIKR